MDYLDIINRDPRPCSFRNPCWFVSVPVGARIVAGVVIAFCLVHSVIFIVFSVEMWKSAQHLKNVSEYQESLKLAPANYEKPVHIFRRIYIRQYLLVTIVSGTFSLYSVLATIPSLLLFCKKTLVVCYCWFANQVLYMISMLTVVILFYVSTSYKAYNSNSAQALVNEEKSQIPHENLLGHFSRNILLLSIIFELVLHIWFFFVIAAYVHNLHAEALYQTDGEVHPNTAMMYYSPASEHPSQILRYGKKGTDPADPAEVENKLSKPTGQE